MNLKNILFLACLVYTQLSFAADNLDVKEVQFKNLKEESVSLVEGSGKPVLLVFWATWCDSCQKEFVQLNQLQKDFKDKVNIFAVNLDNDKEIVNKFLKANPADFKILTSDSSQKLLKQFSGSEKIPAMIFFDKNLDFVASLKGTKSLHQIQGIIRPLILN